MKKLHPWGEFLYARRNAIIWMKEEMLNSDYEIAQILSMDEMQVHLIRVSTAFADHYEKITGRENDHI